MLAMQVTESLDRGQHLLEELPVSLPRILDLTLGVGQHHLTNLRDGVDTDGCELLGLGRLATPAVCLGQVLYRFDLDYRDLELAEGQETSLGRDNDGGRSRCTEGSFT